MINTKIRLDVFYFILLKLKTSKRPQEFQININISYDLFITFGSDVLTKVFKKLFLEFLDLSQENDFYIFTKYFSIRQLQYITLLVGHQLTNYIAANKVLFFE